MSATPPVPYLSEDALAGLGITTAEVIDSIETLIAGSARNSVWSAPKSVILPGDGRYMMSTLAAAGEPPLLAVKTLVLNPRNSDRGLPQINSLVTLLDSETGLPAALMDGNWITAVRTAGLSATAAKYLAEPQSSVIAFIGAGVEARSHLKAFAELYPLEQVRIYSRGQANIDTLGQLATAMGKKVHVCASGEDAIRDADLVVSSVTYSATFKPFLDARRVKPGAFAAITDLGAPWKKETFTAFSRIVVDDTQQEAAMPDKLAPPDLVSGGLADLVLGRIEGRGGGGEPTAFIFRGHALGDLALSVLAYRKAGLQIPISGPN